MAQHPATSDHLVAQETQLLERLLRLYAEERRIYSEVLSLSRRQGELVRHGEGIHKMHRILVAKQKHLDDIAHLEEADRTAREAWREHRERWSGTASARLHAAIQEVGSLIEEILLSEEENDRLLLEMTGLA